MPNHLPGLMRIAFPAHTWRGRMLRRAIPDRFTAGVGPAYRYFTAQVEPTLWSPPVKRPADAPDPLFSVVIPMFNTPDAYLHPLLDCLTNQTFPYFEAIIADASTDGLRAAAIEQACASDPRLRYVRLPGNDGISANTNAALAHAVAPYVAFADHDDTLSRHALNEMARVIVDDPTIDIAYSDEDVLTENGLTRETPFLKPMWSPHMFLECNYTNHLSVIRRSLIEQVGGLRPDFDGAQDYDLLLRLHTLPTPARVTHVPAVLYHWRQAATSTAKNMSKKSYAVDAGRQALNEYMKRVGVDCDGITDVVDQPGWYRVKPRWVVDVAVVCVGPTASQMESLRDATGVTACRPTWVTQARLNTRALPPSDVIVVVQQPYLPGDPTWLDDLVGVLALPDTAAVSPLLVGPTGRVDSAGFAWDAVGVVNIHRGSRARGGDLTGPTHMVRDVDAVSAAVVAVKAADADLLTGGGTLVVVSPQRGHAVVWGHQTMTRAVGLRRDGYVNAHIGVGAMGWRAPR